MTKAETSPRLRGVDCHAHVFDRNAPFARDPGFVPSPNEMGTARDFLAVLDAHGLSHGVIVGSMCYGADNTCLLDALDLAAGRLKGIALLEGNEPRDALEAMARRGVLGMRFNVSPHGVGLVQSDGATRLLDEARSLGWLVQINAKNDDYVALLPTIEKLGGKVLVDHCGRPDVAQGTDARGFAAVLEIGRRGLGTIKLSGAYRFSRQSYPHEDTDAFVSQLIDAYGPENCIWGSDWPFVRTASRFDYGPQLAMLRRWFPDPAVRSAVLWDNPARLFRFG
jgi:predicted TIM-barrel fold metal-dependent hydrolase